jgi:two-component system, NtrC family, response regulator HydG
MTAAKNILTTQTGEWSAVSTSEIPVAPAFGPFIGASHAVRRLYPLFSKLASVDVPLVIEGETGTGKEALAEAIHRSGRRANKPFIIFDCTAVAPSLLEGALFGHERGAYTGADQARAGIFEEADGGTLLIDEIGDLDLGLQSRLLRAIQQKEVRRIGGSRWQKVDVRVIAATRRDLDVEVANGRFRDDLFFRLAVGRIQLPPLRDRLGDIELLARHFWAIHSRNETFPEEILERLEGYSWPGNVRELANTMARLAAFGNTEDDHLFMVRSPSSVSTTIVPPAAPSSHTSMVVPTSNSNNSTTPVPSRVSSIEETQKSIGDFIDSVIARRLTLGVSRDLVIDEFERRYIAFLETAHRDERSRVAAAGVSDRYLRKLRCRMRTV